MSAIDRAGFIDDFTCTNLLPYQQPSYILQNIAWHHSKEDENPTYIISVAFIVLELQIWLLGGLL